MYKISAKIFGAGHNYVPKIWCALKIIVPVLVTCLCLWPTSSAHAQRVTYVQKQANLVKVFKAIKKQTHYNVVWFERNLDTKTTFDANFKNATIDEVLKQVLLDQPASYEINGKTIVIKPKVLEKSEKLKKTSMSTSEALIEVIGRIVDENNEPLIGAIIRLKNGNKSTSSNANGEFQLKDVPENAILLLSYIGYQTHEIAVSTNMGTLKMNQIEGKLSEVEINAGYYTVKNKERTGSISRVDAKIIAEQPVSNPLAALTARMPGVDVVQQTGVPGGGIAVQIRGSNSIASGSQPLYLVDGVPFAGNTLASNLANNITFQASPLNSLSPDDIESIEVLKDADATAIYGSRGANGVVLISTKKGKVGKTRFDVIYYKGSGEVAKQMPMLNTEQYLNMRTEAFKNDARAPSASNAPDLLSWDKTKYTDWQKALIGDKAESSNLQASISGGNQQTSFLLSGGYRHDGTVFPGDFGENKASAALNVTQQSADQKFKASISTQYSFVRSNLFNYDLTNNALVTPPNAPDFLDANGKLVFIASLSNPYVDLYRKYQADTRNLLGNLNLSYQLLPELMLKVAAGYTYMQRNEIRTTPSTTISPTTSTVVSSDFSDSSNESWIAEPQLHYQKRFGKHIITALAGLSFQENLRKAQLLYASGFNNDDMLENLQAATNIKVTSNDYTKYRYTAVFGRLNYNLSDTYLVNLTMRRDGSSRFGPNKQFANFYAIGGAWLFSNESFIKNKLPFLSFGKLRASYGSTGNDQIGDYQFLELWKSSNYPYGGISGLYPDRISNADYAWEVNRKLEVGLETGFLKDRIQLSLSYYRNRSSNQLVGYALPASSGALSVQSNLAAVVQNKGFELELSSSNLKTGAFKWQSSFNISLPQNRLLAYPDIERSAYANVYTVGKSLNTPKLFHYTGVDAKTGIYTFQDLDGDGKGDTFPGDLQALFDLNKKIYGGLGNSFSYHNLSLDVFLQFVKGKGYDYRNGFSSPGALSNQPIYVLSRWQQENDHTNIQRFSGFATNAAFRAYRATGDQKITDASFLRIKNVSLSYTLPVEIIKRFGLQHLRFYFQGQNLLTITHYKGLDPETQNTGSLPPLRVYTFGLNLSL